MSSLRTTLKSTRKLLNPSFDLHCKESCGKGPPKNTRQSTPHKLAVVCCTVVVLANDKHVFGSDMVKFKKLYRTTNLSRYIGMKEMNFLRAATGWLDVGMHEISNVNPVGRVYQLIRRRYRASRHHSKELTGLCEWCGQWMEEVVVPCCPSSEPLRKSPCCDLPVHRHCDSGPACRKCHEQLRVLPCIICRARIVEEVNYAMEYVT